MIWYLAGEDKFIPYTKYTIGGASGFYNHIWGTKIEWVDIDFEKDIFRIMVLDKTLKADWIDILCKRIGILSKPHTYTDIARLDGRSKERIRQITSDMLRKLRHPSRRREFLELCAKRLSDKFGLDNECFIWRNPDSVAPANVNQYDLDTNASDFAFCTMYHIPNLGKRITHCLARDYPDATIKDIIDILQSTQPYSIKGLGLKCVELLRERLNKYRVLKLGRAK